ncbi:NUDIX domain-containing protein [Rubrobacter radiotolerans]|uniref:NUDIX domain-containing protein n=1 Tax=Rubrobacter radiotolerans TaxID=42256 RepID=A0AB35SZY2_RUBRA|nr:NUDIX domain-containing protein [Rubrobacter radiotolerans]MDX5893084.1 NUDIX domain-containing protein [Rubrobacter radiotolerans]
MKKRSSAGTSGSSSVDFGVRVAVAVVRDGAVLLVRHEKPGQEPYRVLPGGRLEPFETIPACARREMLEETGLPVRFERVLYVNEFMREGRHTVDVTVAATLEDDREAALGHDPEVPTGERPTLTGVEWVPVQRLSSVGLLPERVAERLARDLATDGAPSGREVYLGSDGD